MNFPDTPLFQFLYWMINTAGVGGIFVGLLGGSIMLSVGIMLRWIAIAGAEDEDEEYLYPTPTLHSEH